MNGLVLGALTMGYAVAALFFLRFWLRSRDPLFAMFSLAFLVLAIQRLGLALRTEEAEDNVLFYSLRLLAFLLIIVAIWQKNRSAKRGTGARS